MQRTKRGRHCEFNLQLSDLASLTEKICKGEGVDKSELCSGVRKRDVVKSRKIVCQESRKIVCQGAVKKMGYSGADVARFLGITTSAVNRLAASEELPEIEKYL